MIDDRINGSGNERTGIAEDQLIRRFDYIDALMNFIVLMDNAFVQRLANYILPRPLKKICPCILPDPAGKGGDPQGKSCRDRHPTQPAASDNFHYVYPQGAQRSER